MVARYNGILIAPAETVVPLIGVNSRLEFTRFRVRVLDELLFCSSWLEVFTDWNTDPGVVPAFGSFGNKVLMTCSGSGDGSCPSSKVTFCVAAFLTGSVVASSLSSFSSANSGISLAGRTVLNDCSSGCWISSDAKSSHSSSGAFSIFPKDML